MPTYKLTIAYDGTAFAGWQLQAGQRTVQGVIEEALLPLADDRVVVHAAGRTDSGVHAAGQVISFTIPRVLPGAALLRAINVRLPRDVRVMAAEEVMPSFNARFEARRKTYRYAVNGAEVMIPFRRHFAWHVPHVLDLGAMQEAAATVLGEHDFSAFQASGGDVATSRRTILTSTVSRDGDETTYEVTGSGFLRFMVRNIVGTLVDIGRGRLRASDMRRILLSGERREASPTAPPQGLTLWRVDY